MVLDKIARLLLAALVPVLMCPPPVAAAPRQPVENQPPAAPPDAAPFVMPSTRAGRMMERVLRAGGAAEADPALTAEMFSEAFQAQVPFAKVMELLRAVHADQGELFPIRIDSQSGEDSLVLRVSGAKSKSPMQILLGLNPENKIDTLLLRPPPPEEPALRNWADLSDRLRALPGVTNFAAYQVRLLESADPAVVVPPKLAEVHTHQPDARLAIGSTFKLYVLGALADAVQQGKARWDEKLAIKGVYKSLPSGRLQDEVEGHEFALATYADLMISISDNTATDHLIHRLGRDKVETYMGTLHGAAKRNRPFLTTREMFTLKLKPDPTLITRWKMVDEATRRDMLLPDNMARPSRPVGPSHNPGEVADWTPDIKEAADWKTPREIETIEWFASANECCRLMADLARRETFAGMEPLSHALRINPGIPVDKARWTKVGFKGGSEPGVLNLTWLLTRDDGKLYAVSIGWNDPKAPLEESRLIGLAGRAIELLAKEP